MECITFISILDGCLHSIRNHLLFTFKNYRADSFEIFPPCFIFKETTDHCGVTVYMYMYVHTACNCVQVWKTSVLCNNNAVLYQLSYWANWEVVTLRVCNLPIDCETFVQVYFTTLLKLRTYVQSYNVTVMFIHDFTILPHNSNLHVLDLS